MTGINYKNMSRDLLHKSPALIKSWLPKGKMNGSEWVALNPTRVDRNLGSFTINIKTGRWADFATNDKGGDLISLYAYINRLSQYDAAKELQQSHGGK